MPQSGRGEEYRFNSWTTEQGLPQNSVFSIRQSKDGYLWMGTYEGLARFDGVKFKVFDNTNTPDLKNNWVKSVVEDRAGNLWAGTDGSGLFRRVGNELIRDSKSNELPSQRIMTLYADSAGNLWIGTQKGLSLLKNDGELQNFSVRDGLPSDMIRSLTEDGDGVLWIGTDKGLARLKNQKFTVYRQEDGLTNNIINALAWTQADGLWIGTDKGLNLLRNERFINFAAQTETDDYWIMSLAADHAGALWIGTSVNGLMRLADGAVTAELEKIENSPDERILAIYQDSADALWFGGAGTGLIELKSGRFQTLWRSAGLREDYVTAVFEDHSRSLWFSTDKSLYRLTNGKIETHPQPVEGDFYAIAEDRNTALWLASYKDTGRVWHLQNGIFTALTSADGLPNSRVSSIICDRAGNIWIGTSDGLSVFRDGRLAVFRTVDGLISNSVRIIYEARDGSIWIGTSGGISRWRDGQFTSWTVDDGLSSNLVSAFYEAEDSAMWIGTENGGLTRYKNDEFTQVTTHNGLYDNLVNVILESNEELWMSSNKGIYRVSLQELNDFADGRVPAVTSYSYGMADGMLLRECTGAGRAGWKTADGNLWFPTVRGLVKIDMTKRNWQPPIVVIENVKVDEQMITADISSVEIAPGQENLEIDYTALSWERPQHIKFKYRLEGLDNGWTIAGTRRAVYYTHLPAGEYTFRVIADNGDGVWNIDGKSLRIKVLPPFYRTWWFYSLILVGISAVFFFVYNYRERRLEKRNEQQKLFSQQIIQSQEQERKRIAANLHDSLGQQLLVIKNWAMLELAMNAGKKESREALDEISGAASAAIEEVREIIYDLRPYQLDKIGLTKTIRFMIAKLAAASNIEFIVRIGEIDGVFDYDSEITFYRIVQECLNNILKHSDARRALVEIVREESKINLLIEDDGKGFSYEPDTAKNTLRGGFGLTGISERVQMLGGAIAINAAPGTGTKISVSILLKENL